MSPVSPRRVSSTGVGRGEGGVTRAQGVGQVRRRKIGAHGVATRRDATRRPSYALSGESGENSGDYPQPPTRTIRLTSTLRNRARRRPVAASVVPASASQTAPRGPSRAWMYRGKGDSPATQRTRIHFGRFEIRDRSSFLLLRNCWRYTRVDI